MSGKKGAGRIANGIRDYCKTYNIPIDDILDILEDQKVLPMIRGKATEHLGAAVLRQVLDSREWDVQKLNLNPQPGRYDEDVSVTFRRTGVRLKAETKNAVRGKFSLGTRNTPEPHFAVKCHKSRSHLTRKRNDRYEVGDFDLLLCNVSNAIFRAKPMGRGLPLIASEEALSWLKDHYGEETDDELVQKTYSDWRACFPMDIAAPDGTLPRTPRVLMSGDSHWFDADQLPERLLALVDSSS